MFPKTANVAFFKKGFGSKLLGAAKGIASIADEPIVQSVIGAINPGVGAALAASKKFGLLERVKRL